MYGKKAKLCTLVVRNSKSLLLKTPAFGPYVIRVTVRILEGTCITMAKLLILDGSEVILTELLLLNLFMLQYKTAEPPTY